MINSNMNKKFLISILKQTILITFIISLIICFTKSILKYNQKIEQQKQSDIEGISLYEKNRTFEYLKEKYPKDDFEIICLLEKNRVSVDKSNVSSGSIIVGKKFLVRSNNETKKEFILEFNYIISNLELLKHVVTEIIYFYNNSKMPEVIPYYYDEDIKDNYKYNNKLVSKQLYIDNQIINYVLDISNNYLDKINSKIFLSIAYKTEIINDNIKTLENFLYELNNKNQKLNITIIISINEEKENLDNKDLKKYYKISKNIANNLIKELKLKNYDITIQFANFDKIIFEELKKYPGNLWDDFFDNYYNDLTFYINYHNYNYRLYGSKRYLKYETKYKEFYKNFIEGVG